MWTGLTAQWAVVPIVIRLAMDDEAVLPLSGHLCFKNITATFQNYIGQGPET